jgi:hypothetical protein
MRRFGVLLALGMFACADNDLQALDDVNVKIVDNLLEVEGTVCTDAPSTQDFPVKILFLIDGSGSMQFVDPFTRRASSVEETILRLRANANVSFSVIRFNESDQVLTKPGADITANDPLGTDFSGAFTRDPGILQQAVVGLQVADSVTDYQGALSAAYQVLSADMRASDPATLARSKYVILFLSDGDPFPDCCSVASQTAGLCDRTANIFFCENPDALRQNPSTLPFLVGGLDYNQPFQIYQVVRDIMELKITFGVGDMRLHTAFLFDATLVGSLDANGCYSIGGVTFTCPDEARPLLQSMADLGEGVFRDFSQAEQIDFLGFDLTSIRRENSLKNLIVMNSNAIPEQAGLILDSDGDGLDDQLEFANNLNRLAWDTDADGYGDALEWKLRDNGLDGEVPNVGCETASDRRDEDADGLATCEERLLRTSAGVYDTDADGIPDRIELMRGTDPTESDVLRDSDLDGVRNGDEIRSNTPIGADEGSLRTAMSYRYTTSETGLNDQGGLCYQFGVRNIQLDTPLSTVGDPSSFGRNQVLVYMGQAPFDDPTDFGSFKVACVEARYIAPDFKDPGSGKVVLGPDNFKAPDLLDLSADCVGYEGPVVP